MSRRALADGGDGGGHRRLGDRENAEHSDLGQQVRPGRKAERLFPAEDGALANQVADRQRGAHEDGADAEQDQYLGGFGGRLAMRVGKAESGVAGGRSARVTRE
jgi:hypothetical protein